MKDLEKQVKEATIEHLGFPVEDYVPEKTLEQLGADDLDVIGLLMHLEDTLNLPQFPDELFFHWSTPREITEWLEENVFADS